MADKAIVRVLTEDERKKLEDNSKVVSDFKQNKLEKEAQKNWDLFYKRNTTNFFKDRHWTTAEFKELLFDNWEVSKLIWTTMWTNEWKFKSFKNSCQMTHHKALIRRGHSPFGQQPLQVGRGWGGGGRYFGGLWGLCSLLDNLGTRVVG